MESHTLDARRGRRIKSRLACEPAGSLICWVCWACWKDFWIPGFVGMRLGSSYSDTLDAQETSADAKSVARRRTRIARAARR